MNKQTENALKIAIEALERVDRWLQERHMGNLTPLEKDALQACKEALEQPAQEPTWIVNDTAGTKLRQYTHPAPSWQGLSDDEVDDIWFEVVKENNFEGTGKYFWRAIEQALKEKNG